MGFPPADARPCRPLPCAATARRRAGARQPSRRVLGNACLARELRVLVLDGPDVTVEDDAFAAGECDKPFPLGPADQRKPGLTREVDPPGGEARARDQD